MPSRDSSTSPPASESVRSIGLLEAWRADTETAGDFEPPALVWVNVHHPTDIQQDEYRKFIRSSVTKEQHRKFRNDRGVKRSRSPTPLTAQPARCRRRSSPSTTAVSSPAKPRVELRPDWLVPLLPPYVGLAPL